jgi:hypothetical protein
MSDSNQLRKRASQLFAMARKGRETGFVAATELENLASEALAQAEDMERRASHPPTPEARRNLPSSSNNSSNPSPRRNRPAQLAAALVVS